MNDKQLPIPIAAEWCIRTPTVGIRLKTIGNAYGPGIVHRRRNGEHVPNGGCCVCGCLSSSRIQAVSHEWMHSALGFGCDPSASLSSDAIFTSDHCHPPSESESRGKRIAFACDHSRTLQNDESAIRTTASSMPCKK